MPPLSIKAELEALETRKATLTIASAETPVPALHPQMAEVFRQKATTLAADWNTTSSATPRARRFAGSSTRS